MDYTLISIVRLLHMMSMAVWFGASLVSAGDIRRTLALGRPHTQGLPGRVKLAGMLEISSGVLTVLSGLGLIFIAGGFKMVPRTIHISLVLALAVIAVGLALARPTWGKIANIIEGDGDLSAAVPFSKKYAMYTGIQHLLRTVIMVLMVVKF